MTSTFHRTGLRRALFTVSLLVAAVGCASTPEPQSALDADLAGAPDWVTRGCAGAENRICGVGSAVGMQNSWVRRSAAIGRARTDIARSLQTRVVSLLKDYASSTTGGPEFHLASNDEQHIVDVSRQITNMTLAGTEVIDTWVTPGATFYALVTLDVDKFTQTVGRMNQLSQSVRSAVIDRADEAFAELDESAPR